MRYFHSEYNFRKYRPRESCWQRVRLHFTRKRQRITTPRYGKPSYRTVLSSQSSSVRSRLGLRLFLLCSVLTVWLACLLYIPFFHITNVAYDGLSSINQHDISNRVTVYLQRNQWLPSNNFFLVNEQKLKKIIQETITVERAEVIKQFPHRISITIHEKPFSLIYDNGSTYVLLDSGGTVVKILRNVLPGEFTNRTTSTANEAAFFLATTGNPSVPSSTATSSLYEHVPNYQQIQKTFGDYPIVYDQRAIPVAVKQTGILPVEFIEAVAAWHTELIRKGIAKPKYFIIENMNAGMRIVTNKTWDIIMEPTMPVEEQLTNLKTFLAAITVQPREYINVRFGSRVYWK